jgi:hypothetical protein
MQQMPPRFRKPRGWTLWTDTAPDDVVASRAGGRRRYNAWRRRLALQRRVEVARLLGEGNLLREWGKQTRIARQLGVSRSTICRDVKAINRALLGDAGSATCRPINHALRSE